MSCILSLAPECEHVSRCPAVSCQGTSEGEFLLLSHRADVGADGFTERLHIKTYPKRLKGSFP